MYKNFSIIVTFSQCFSFNFFLLNVSTGKVIMGDYNLFFYSIENTPCKL